MGLAEDLHNFVDNIPLGRIFCNRCDSWDHECGCYPDIKDTLRKELHEDIQKIIDEYHIEEE